MPPNLVIIGTMNSVDRIVALVDYTLRRNIGFVHLDPEASVIEQVPRFSASVSGRRERASASTSRGAHATRDSMIFRALVS